jgi:hypothetical protein
MGLSLMNIESINCVSSFYNLGTKRIEIGISNSLPYCVLIRCCGTTDALPLLIA